MSITTIRTRTRDYVEAVYKAVQGWLTKYPLLMRIYVVFSWISLIFFIVSLLFMKESRTMLVQYLWSFYVLLQFWLLCRSKTLSWKQVSLFTLSGVLFVVPLTNLTMQLFHSIFGGQTSDTWSIAVVTPIIEEMWKLLPLALFLFFSRRATALSLSDYILLGAAPGVGFQLFEELSRRWVNRNYSSTFLGGETIHWDVFTWFPGHFEESFIPTMMNVSHPVHTAMIALGIGIAYRFRKRLTYWVYLFPGILLLWSILNHAAWNGQNKFPDWVMSIHEWTGDGYATKGFFLTMLVAALVMDYYSLNKIGKQLPRLKSEGIINPFTELWQMLTTLIQDRKRLTSLTVFYRERRELGFSLLYGNEEAQTRINSIQEKIQKYAILLGATGILLLIAGLFAGMHFALVEPDNACFACLFDSLQNWWDRLSGWEQGAIVLGLFALSFMFVGFWPALGLALTGMSIAGSGHTTAGYIRDPKKLLSPQNAIAVATAIILSRIPVGKGLKWLSDRLGPRAKKVLDTIKSKFGQKPKPVRQPHDIPDKKDKPDSRPNDQQKEVPKESEAPKPKESELTEPTTSGGSPKGNYEKPDPKDPRPITRQNETADLLAEKGYDVEMLPETKGGNGHGIKPESNPDFLINGKAFDCYSPDTTNVRNIWSTVEGKTQKQAGGIVINLDDYTGSIDKLMKQFNDWPIEGLDELFIIKDGGITRWFP